jgi:hypothetical protein
MHTLYSQSCEAGQQLLALSKARTDLLELRLRVAVPNQLLLSHAVLPLRQG